MKTKILKRREILKALRSEPLAYGDWADGKSSNGPPCEVCAVGAVVRQALRNGADPTVNQIVDVCFLWITDAWNAVQGDPLVLLKQQQYWTALSCFFEAGLRPGNRPPKKVTQKDREKLCDFVKKHFPKEIEVPLE